MKKTIRLFLLLFVIFISCSDDDDKVIDPVELVLDKTELTLSNGGSGDVVIESGNGDYEVTSSNPRVAKATVSGNVITVTGVSEEQMSTAEISVTDKLRKKVKIDVTVINGDVTVDLLVSPKEVELDLAAYTEEEMRDTISITSGNFDYVIEVLEGGLDFIELDESLLAEENKFIVIAKAAGEAIVEVTDGKNEKAEVLVKVIDTTVELKVSATEVELDYTLQDEPQVVISIEQGNSEYKLELLDNADEFIELDEKKLAEEGKFIIKAKAIGEAKVKVSDRRGKFVIIEVSVIESEIGSLEVDTESLEFSTLFDEQQIKILSGGGNYKVRLGNRIVAKASVDLDVIKVSGKMKGETVLTIEDAVGNIVEVPIKVTAPEYALSLHQGEDLKEHYFAYTNYRTRTEEEADLKSLKEVTFEINCLIKGYRGLQTFMGYEGYLMIRGEGDQDGVVRIVSAGDELDIRSINPFPLNEWLHLAFVVDLNASTNAERYKLYRNGELDEIKFVKEEFNYSEINLNGDASKMGGKFVVGLATDQEWRAMQGVVSYARIWKEARTAGQIKSNMNNLVETNLDKLVSFWNFSEGKETSVIHDLANDDNTSDLTITKVKYSEKGYEAVPVKLDDFQAKGVIN